MLRRFVLCLGGAVGLAALAAAGDGPSAPKTRDLTPADRAVSKSVTIAAPRAAVWRAWSSAAGVKAALGVESQVVLAPGGAYEWYFLPDTADHRGARGGEGNRVLSYLPERMLSFTWNAPPSFPQLRSQRTWVVVELAALDAGRTRVTLTHLGWGQGGRWDELQRYFDAAWGAVLAAHRRNLERGAKR